MRSEIKSRLIEKLREVKYPLHEQGALVPLIHEDWLAHGAACEGQTVLEYLGATEKEWSLLYLASILYMPPAKIIEELESESWKDPE